MFDREFKRKKRAKMVQEYVDFTKTLFSLLFYI